MKETKLAAEFHNPVRVRGKDVTFKLTHEGKEFPIVGADVFSRPIDMRRARRAYKADPKEPTLRGSFRTWVRETYAPVTCTGKLAQIVFGPH